MSKNKRKLEDLTSLTDSQINKIYAVMEDMQDLCTTSRENTILLSSLTDAMIWCNDIDKPRN